MGDLAPPAHLAPTSPAVTVPSLRATDLSLGHWRDEPVMTGLSLHLSGPGWLHLVAPNGAGKTTLFEAFAGYLTPLDGTMEVCGRPVRPGHVTPGLRVVRADAALVPGVTLRDHIHLYSRRHRRPDADLLGLAERLGLTPHLHKAPHALSTGTLQKAWLLCNVVGGEEVWCFDEPFNGLDEASTATMVQVLAERARESLVVMTAHHLPSGLATVADPEQTIPRPFRADRVVLVS